MDSKSMATDSTALEQIEQTATSSSFTDLVVGRFDQIEIAKADLQEITLDDVILAFMVRFDSEQTKRAYWNDLVSFFLGDRAMTCKSLGKMERRASQRHLLAQITLADIWKIPFSDLVKSITVHLHKSSKFDEEQAGRVLNARTVNRKASALSGVFGYIIESYDYPKNPVKLAYRHKPTKKVSSTISLNRSEIVDFLEFTKSRCHRSKTAFRDHLIVIFGFALALRRNEIAHLKWSDIDFTNRKIEVYDKGGKSKDLPIPQALCDLLRDFKAEHRQDYYPYIFTPTSNHSHSTLEKPLSPDRIFAIIRRIAKYVVPEKWDKITPHSLRKSAIEQALANGEDLSSIANMTGHKSIEMVRFYDGRSRLKNNAVHGLAKFI